MGGFGHTMAAAAAFAHDFACMKAGEELAFIGLRLSGLPSNFPRPPKR